MAKIAGSGWFACPNAVFEQCHTAYELAILSYLYRCAGPDGSSFPSFSTIAKHTKISVRTVIRSLNNLTARGVVKRARRESNHRGHTSSLYTVSLRGGLMTDRHKGSVTQSPPLCPTDPRSSTKNLKTLTKLTEQNGRADPTVNGRGEFQVAFRALSQKLSMPR